MTDAPGAVAQARAAIQRSIDAKRRLTACLDHIAEASAMLGATLAGGGKLLIFGNGGSASDAQHIAAELVGRYRIERRGLPAVALNTDTSALTAIGNDYGYDRVFSRQVEALGRPGDLVIGLSTSGNSPNVIHALETAKSMGLATIALTGGRASKCETVADLVIRVPDTETARVQESHILIGHVLCEILDNEHGGSAADVPVYLHLGVDEVLRERRQFWADSGARVVLTNGIFDLLHAGHLSSLESARQFGDVLVVALNGDRSTTRLKGAGRPIVPEADRARLLLGLSVVDHVVIFDDDTAADVVAALRPDVWCKGGDYSSRDRSTIPEVAVVESYGGTVAFVPFEDGHSTTSYVDRIRSGSAG